MFCDKQTKINENLRVVSLLCVNLNIFIKPNISPQSGPGPNVTYKTLYTIIQQT